MNTFSIIKENLINKGRRLLKVSQFGAKTADVVSDFGDDSAPLKDMIAVYSNTSEVGDNIIIGYLNKNQIANAGEKRIFSLKEDGSLSIAIHLRNNGTAEIGGNVDNAVRYAKLDLALQNEVTLINAELTKIAAAINAIVPGSYIPTPITLNILAAKIEELKTP